ncbi:MAG: hypothetical protein JF887_12745 [Candidatus Dormibacteraeota bacterium]|uniref:DUF4143 domain-containing protein n=1 Tax=Candidatus Amunia macphersoniae TaxID=3127014 RepID=A0A934NAL3_9BACT|nr:hypothetical protein [Candidatus Dormibacteraeota bacterium]
MPAHQFHLRERQGRHEADVLAEIRDGGVVGCEIKAASAPQLRDAQHLVWLRDQLGLRFVAGVVFHTGPRAYELGDRVRAIPICALWG